MEYQPNSWYRASMIKRIRTYINIILMIIGILIVYINHAWIAEYFKNIF